MEDWLQKNLVSVSVSTVIKPVANTQTIPSGDGLTWNFLTLRRWRSDVRSKTLYLEFWISASSGLAMCGGTLWWRGAGAASCSAPSVAPSGGWATEVYGALRCQHFRALEFVLSHPIVSTKHPSVCPTSGEKRKAITFEIIFKISAQV